FEGCQDSEQKNFTEAERKKALAEFIRVAKETIKPGIEDAADVVARYGHSLSIVDALAEESPSISLKIAISGEEYSGKTEPSTLKYAFDPHTLTVRTSGWITVPSKRNFTQVFPVGEVESSYFSREKVKRRVEEMFSEILALTNQVDKTRGPSKDE
ncbi:MAG: hypothetical protein QXX77_06865, partial [Candidatus Methanosuratincola sp.]